MPRPYPREFREDVVRVARNRGPGVTLDIDAGRRVRGHRRTATTSSARAGEDRAAVRAWARENGHEISDRGRIPTSVLEAYRSAR